MKQRLREWGGHLVLALVVSFPILLSPFSRLIGDPRVDVWNHAWGPWWWAQALSQGELPWRTPLLQTPDGGVLWFIDPTLATLGAPLVGLLGVAATWNLVLLLYVAFASWAARRLALALGAGPQAAWLASLAYAASAWMVCELHNGISEAVNIGFIALSLAFTEEALREGRGLASWRPWVKVGLALGLATWGSPYYGLATGLVIAVRALPHVQVAWIGALTAALVASPAMVLMRAALDADGAIIKRPAEMNTLLLLHNAVDPREFVAPLGFRSADLSAEGFEHSLYIGLAALALALFARQRWIWVAVVLSGLFALGPYLVWNHELVMVGEGSALRLPWWLFSKGLNLAVTHPRRLGVPALALVSGLAALGAHKLYQRWPRPWLLPALGLLVLGDGLLISGAPWPLATASADIPAVYSELSGARHEGILPLPTDAGTTMATSRYLYWQTAHWHPLPYPPDVHARTSALMPWPFFQRLSYKVAFADEKDRPTPADVSQERYRSDLLTGAAEANIRWIVIHPELDEQRAAELKAELEVALGAPTRVEGDWYWDLSEQ